MDDLIAPLYTPIFKKGVEDGEVWPLLYRHFKREEDFNRVKLVIHLRRSRRLHLHSLKTTVEFCGDIDFRE